MASGEQSTFRGICGCDGYFDEGCPACSPGENSPGGRMRTPAEMVAGLKALATHLSRLDSASPEAGLMRDAALYIAGATDSLREHTAMVREARAVAASRPCWQPIEDVPPDIMHSADPVLLWSPDTHTCVVYGRYWTQTERWEEDHMSTPLHPTHWMPLPEPPDAR